MIAVEVEDEAWTAALPDVDRIVERAAEAALRIEPSVLLRARGRGEGAPSPHRGGEISVLLTDAAAVRELNARFRGKDAPTNVLSFPAPESARPHLGDVALAYGVCAREAAEQGKRLEQHLTHLVAHGVLHLLGYDHQHDAEAEKMEGLERSLMAALGCPDPYAEALASESHG